MSIGPARRSWAWPALIILTGAVCLLRLLIDRDPSAGLGLAWPDASYARFRWTALANAAVAGVALAVSGVLLQALLRNPLASPFILGVSSGAGLGVMAALYAFHRLGGGIPAPGILTAPALIGALGALTVVYSLGQRRGLLDPISLVLVGVVVATICSAGIMFFQHLVPTGLRGEFTTWLMGYIPEGSTWTSIAVAAAVTGAGVSLALLLSPAMDAASLNDAEARSVGVDVRRLRPALFALAGLLAAVAVTVVGPIGFVGLVAPHAARLLIGHHHAGLVVSASLCGVLFLVGADVLRQTVDVGAGRMPPGIFTALVGGPFFLWLLVRDRRGQ